MSTVYQCSACFSTLWLHVNGHSPVSTGDIFGFTGNMKKLSVMAPIQCAIATTKIRKRPFLTLLMELIERVLGWCLFLLAIFEMFFANQHSVV